MSALNTPGAGWRGYAAKASVPPAATQEDMERAYRKVVHDHAGSKAAALLTRIGMDRGIEEASHLAIRTSLDDLGRLGHNLATAVAYGDVATTLGLPRGLVPLANLGYVQAVSLQGVPPIDIPSLRSEEHTSELQSRSDLVCRLLLEKKKKTHITSYHISSLRNIITSG